LAVGVLDRGLSRLRGFVWFLAGVEGAEAYLAAYLLEKSLSLDNDFVFSVIFTSFAVPERDRYHVLFYGVIGAIVFRAIFVIAGTALLSAFSWLVFVFGAFLIFTGLRMVRRGHDEQTDYRNNRVLKLFGRRRRDRSGPLGTRDGRAQTRKRERGFVKDDQGTRRAGRQRDAYRWPGRLKRKRKTDCRTRQTNC
jgi:predicted tellurium resistance membrane protein TerC